MTLVAAINALQHDAKVWDRVAEVTDQAAKQADALTLGEADLSWASNSTGLLATYQAIQRKVGTLLHEGTKVYQDLSHTLDKVAYAYQANDHQAATELKGVWDARG